MNRMSGGILAAAVSEAGGLGTFGGAARMLRGRPATSNVRSKQSVPARRDPSESVS